MDESPKERQDRDRADLIERYDEAVDVLSAVKARMDRRILKIIDGDSSRAEKAAQIARMMESYADLVLRRKASIFGPPE